MQPRKNRKTRKNQIIVQGSCSEIPSNFLIDSGASASLVATRLVYNAGLTHKIKPTATLIAGLDNNLVPMKGEIKLPIKIGRCNIQHTFIVCDILDNEFLLGVDAMRKLAISIDIPNQQITLSGKENIPFLNSPESLQNRMKIRCNKTVRVY